MLLDNLASNYRYRLFEQCILDGSFEWLSSSLEHVALVSFLKWIFYDACPGSITIAKKLTMCVSLFCTNLFSNFLSILPWFCPSTRQVLFRFPDRGSQQTIIFCVLIIFMYHNKHCLNHCILSLLIIGRDTKQYRVSTWAPCDRWANVFRLCWIIKILSVGDSNFFEYTWGALWIITGKIISLQDRSHNAEFRLIGWTEFSYI